MIDVAVIVPVLGRPHNARPLVESLNASTHRARIIFVVSPNDPAQQAACDETWADMLVVPWEPGPADYARKINLAYPLCDEPLVLLGADDLRFHPGWLEAVEVVADGWDCGVIGTNDRANPLVIAGTHSTHPVVRRCYIDEHGGSVGEPGTVYHDGYDHQWVDNELVATAQARGCYAHAHGAVVEHLHPLYNRQVETDATYAKGQAQGHADRALYESRRHLWEHAAVPV